MARFTYALAALLTVVQVPAHGQESPPRYVPIPVEGSFASLFKERLQAAKDESPLRKLWNEIQHDPTKFKLDPALLKQLNLENPALRTMLKGLMAKHSEGAPLSLQDLDGLTKTLDGIKAPDAGGAVPAAPPDPVAPASDAAMPAFSEPSKMGQQPRPDRLDRWLRNWASQAEDTKLGDWLRDSPAFQKGLGDLKTLIDFKSNPSLWGLDNLPAHLRFTDNLNLGLGDGLLTGFKHISIPELPHMNLPHVNLGNWSVSAPRLPHFGGLGGPNAGQPLLWVVIIVAAVLLIWQVAKGFGPGLERQPTQRSLGPWPVDPANVGTRRQLIQAFDYLALLLFGAEARTWNHRAISRKMLEAKLQTGAVEALASFYETARYTMGPEPLGAGERAAIRRHLLLLTEVPAS